MRDLGPLLRRLSHQAGRRGLRARLILFGTLLTGFVVLIAFLAVSRQIKMNTRRLMAEELAENQRVALDQQRLNHAELLRTAGLITENSTLKAALDTYRLESLMGDGARQDLLATIENEVRKIASALDKDLLVVTDDAGEVLAVSERVDLRLAPGDSLASRPVVQHALYQEEPVGEGNFSVLHLDEQFFQVSCVPIVLQGYIIGTIIHGDRLDEELVGRLQDLLGGEVLVTLGGHTVVATPGLPGDQGRAARAIIPDSGAPGGRTRTVRIGGEEYVVASLSLGLDEGGHLVQLHLLHSLTRRLEQANASLFFLFVTAGSAAILLAGALAVMMSRSILRPLQRFVSFMRSVAKTRDVSRRFEEKAGSPEVATLAEAYDQLMDSLVRTREELSGAREDLVRLDRLKEGEKMAALGRMLSGAAHEINNPLSAVVGNIELLLSRGSWNERDHRRLESVLREGRRVAALVRNLLRVSRRSEDERGPVDLAKVIQDSLSICRHEFVSEGVELVEDLAPEPLPVHGIELELQQVFLNLLNNARDAMRESPKPHWLRIRTRIQGEEILAEVADSGPGIREPGKIFEPFYTTKEIGKGTGLGLSICHGIAESHGGRITAENRPEGGAVFSFVLPVHHASEPPADGLPAPAPSATSAREALEASILIVEDEESILEFQAELLGTMGAKVTGARTGSEAIRLLETRGFDLIITDLKMPGGVSGQDLFGWIERNRPGERDRVIFITGDSMGEASQTFLSSVPNRYLTKPFSIDEYIALVEEMLHEPAPVA